MNPDRPVHDQKPHRKLIVSARFQKFIKLAVYVKTAIFAYASFSWPDLTYSEYAQKQMPHAYATLYDSHQCRKLQVVFTYRTIFWRFKFTIGWSRVTNSADSKEQTKSCSCPLRDRNVRLPTQEVQLEK